MLEGFEEINVSKLDLYLWKMMKEYELRELSYGLGDPTNIKNILKKLREGGNQEDLAEYLDAIDSWRRVSPALIETLPIVFQLLQLENWKWKFEILFVLDVFLEKNPKREERYLTNDYLGNELYDLVESHEENLLALLYNHSIAIRFMTLDVWSNIVPGYTNRFFPMIMKVIREEHNQRQRVYLLKYVSNKVGSKNKDELISTLLEDFYSTTSNYFKSLLAYSLVGLLKEDVPLDAIKVLVDSVVLKDLYQCDDMTLSTYVRVHLKMNHTYRRIYDCGYGIAHPALFHILKYTNEPIHWNIKRHHGNYIYKTEFSLYVAILDQLFGKMYYQGFRDNKLELIENSKEIKPPISYWQKRDIQTPKRLDKYQYEFLVWLVADDRFWGIEHNLLIWYGLPVNREQLRKFVAKRAPK